MKIATAPADCRVCLAAEYAYIDLGIGPLDAASVDRLHALINASGDPHSDDAGQPCVTEADLADPTPEEQADANALALDWLIAQGATALTVTCEFCGATHPAEYSHEGQYGEGPIYAVVCPAGPADRGWVTDYYTAEALHASPRQDPS